MASCPSKGLCSWRAVIRRSWRNKVVAKERSFPTLHHQLQHPDVGTWDANHRELEGSADHHALSLIAMNDIEEIWLKPHGSVDVTDFAQERFCVCRRRFDSIRKLRKARRDDCRLIGSGSGQVLILNLECDVELRFFPPDHSAWPIAEFQRTYGSEKIRRRFHSCRPEPLKYVACHDAGALGRTARTNAQDADAAWIERAWWPLTGFRGAELNA